MAHNIATQANGTPMMAYAGQTPWHRLGTAVDNPMTSAEAMTLAGMDWTTELVPVMTREDVPRETDHWATMRSDNRAILGVVGRGWKPIHNRDAFSFMDSLVAERKIRYETVGGLGAGERVWMLARVDGDIRVQGSDDVVNRYLLLANGHDGRSGLRVFWTPIRVVCQNTLSAAISRAGKSGVAIRHTGSVFDKIKEAQTVLGLSVRYYDELGPRINALASYQMSPAILKRYFEAVYPDPIDPDRDRAAANARQTRTVLEELFEGGIGHDMPGVRGTAWAAYNAVTGYIDHRKPQRDRKDRTDEESDSVRLNNIWWGDGAAIKQRAWDAGMALVGAN